MQCQLAQKQWTGLQTRQLMSEAVESEGVRAEHLSFLPAMLRKRQGLQLVPGLPDDTADSLSLSSSHKGAVTVRHYSHEPDLANGFRRGQKIFQGSMVCPDDYRPSQKMLSVFFQTKHHS